MMVEFIMSVVSQPNSKCVMPWHVRLSCKECSRMLDPLGVVTGTGDQFMKILVIKTVSE